MCVRVGDLVPRLAARVMMMLPGRVPRSRFERDGAIADVPRAAAAGGLKWGLVAVDYFDSWAGPGREVVECLRQMISEQQRLGWGTEKRN